ncbi:MAG: hypothetical protein ABSF36_03470 [Candidatus Methanomethylicaceae archaeon]|jgi:5-methylcytosine-specific restriction enzyme subunit McrC
MAEELITVPENSLEKELEFYPSKEDEAYLHSKYFNRGSKKNIRITYTRLSDHEYKPKITVGPYAGIIQLSEKRIHFSTKVNTNLFYLLSSLKDEEEFLYDPETPIEIKEGMNFFDILGRFFQKELDDVIRKGLLRKYVRKQENARFAKGKILIKGQIKKNMIYKSRFFCEFEDLTFDNKENQMVLSALHSLISLIKFDQKLRSKLRRHEIALKDFITLVNMDPHECSFIRFNRINQHYEDIIRLSRLILEERFIRSVYKGESRGFNFIVDMNKVYEDFITEMVEEVIGTEFKDLIIERQPRFNKLVEEKTIVTKPDIVLRKGKAEYPFIIDTKYKKDPANADYYQVIAYSLALRKSKACCLIYPKSEASEIDRELTLVRDLTGEDSSKVKIYARTVDLHLDDCNEIGYEDYIAGVKEQLKQIMSDFMTEAS